MTGAGRATFTVYVHGTFRMTSGCGVVAPRSVTEHGRLPRGLRFTASGARVQLSGTPAAGTAGPYQITVIAADGMLPPDTRHVTILARQ